ncbi:MAG: MATE family efflux transporter [Spirochaetales bacterium]|nr:MATE family efflux transporter [Spirochaetales bacterium]
MNPDINETIIHGLDSKPNPARDSFLNSSLNSLIFKNAVPAIASMLIMAFYQMVDGIMVGQRLGPDALASVNILYPVIAIFVGIAVMIGVGGNARIAVLLGEGDSRTASKVLTLISLLGLLLGLISYLVVGFGFKHILTFLGSQGGDLGVFAGEYLRSIFWFFPTMILIFILEQSVRNDGKATFATIIMVLMAILNIVLDYLFLFVADMGIGGAAIASGISQSLGFLVFFLYFLGKTIKKSSGLRFSLPTRRLSVLPVIFINGSSEFFNSVAAGVTTWLFNRIIISYVGTDGIAAFTLVQYISLIGIMIFLGLNNGCQPILSYNYGALQYERVRQTFYKILKISVSIGFAFFLILFFFTGNLVLIFVKQEPELIALTTELGRFFSFAMLFMPVGIAGSMFFTALEKARYSLIVAFSRSLLFVVVGLLVFPTFLGEKGIWITPFFTEFMSACITFLLYLSLRKRLKKV